MRKSAGDAIGSDARVHLADAGDPGARHPYTFGWQNAPLAWLTAREVEIRANEIWCKLPHEAQVRLRCFQPVPPELVAEIPEAFARCQLEADRLLAESYRLWVEGERLVDCHLLWIQACHRHDDAARYWSLEAQAAFALRVVPDAPWREGALRVPA